jgi:Holliday junction resolvase
MVDSRAKGAKGETDVRDALRKHTGLKWERVPGSGALDAKHGLKGDLYVPGADNKYCVEVKFYEEDHLTSALLTGQNPQLLQWWQQTIREAGQVNKKPILIFKFNRSKMFVAQEEMPSANYRNIFIDINGYNLYVSLLEDYLINEEPEFI